MIQFCPLALDWGDIATWVSAAVTLLAVLVAIFLPLHVFRAEERRHEDDRKRVASALAVGLHAELSDVAGKFALVAAIDHQFPAASEVDRFENLGVGVSKLEISTIDRFVDRLDVFDSKVGAQLLLVLRAVANVRHAAAIPEHPVAAQREVAAAASCQSILRMSQLGQKWALDAIGSMHTLAQHAGISLASAEEQRANIERVAAEPLN